MAIGIFMVRKPFKYEGRLYWRRELIELDDEKTNIKLYVFIKNRYLMRVTRENTKVTKAYSLLSGKYMKVDWSNIPTRRGEPGNVKPKLSEQPAKTGTGKHGNPDVAPTTSVSKTENMKKAEKSGILNKTVKKVKEVISKKPKPDKKKGK